MKTKQSSGPEDNDKKKDVERRDEEKERDSDLRIPEPSKEVGLDVEDFLRW